MPTEDFPTADTVDGKVHVATLVAKVTADTTITTALSNDRPIEEVVVASVPNVRYSFVATISAAERTRLRDVVHAGHVGNPPAPLTENAHHTIATLPPADEHKGTTAWVTDDASGEVLAVSDGTNWIRVHDQVPVGGT